MSVVHPQSHGSWQISLPPLELLSCLILTLRRKPCKLALLKIRVIRGCTSSGLTSVPLCWSILLSKIYPYLASSPPKSIATVFGTPIGTQQLYDYLGKIGFSGMGGDCNGLPPGWSARPHKTCRLARTHRDRQAPHVETQDMRARRFPCPTRKGHPPGNRALHCCHGSYLL